MHEIESRARPYACRLGADWPEAPIQDILGGTPFQEMARGIFHRVFRLGDAGLVLKEARWDPSVPVGTFELPLPAQAIEENIPYMNNVLLPTQAEARRQYEEEYLLFAEYFGYFDPFLIPEPETYPDLERLWPLQRRVRESLPQALSSMEEAYGWYVPEGLHDLVSSEAAAHNFLPREFLLWGQGISPESTGQQTSFILQEFIDGTTLHDVEEDALQESPAREQMILLCVLILLLQAERRVLPDTRPRQPLWQGHEWLRRTDNVILSGDGMKFIDTRWLWRRGINPFARGFVIPELVTQSCLTTIAELC